jgi:hypothetical protein
MDKRRRIMDNCCRRKWRRFNHNKLSNTRFYVDAAGNIFVADYGNSRIQNGRLELPEGITVAGGNGTGSNANQLYYPYDVSVTAGTIYVLDTNIGRVQNGLPMPLQEPQPHI